MDCKHPENSEQFGWSQGCRCERCAKYRSSKRDVVRKEQVAARRAEQLARNLVERPGCATPQFTALTSYAKGCRCAVCVEARRVVSRRCQKAAYDRDPAKFSYRQREYLKRVKAQREATDGTA